jgi:carboxylesterase type B
MYYKMIQNTRDAGSCPDLDVYRPQAAGTQPMPVLLFLRGGDSGQIVFAGESAGVAHVAPAALVRRFRPAATII